MSKIGIMGGTFNPIHIGHLMLAQGAAEEFELDEVWFVPTGYSYMKDKQEGISWPVASERLEMTRLAIRTNPVFECLDIEVKRAGNTYTYETLEELAKQYPRHEFFFIFGADCLFGIDKWKEPGRIFAVSSIIAAVRDNYETEAMQEQIAYLQAKYDARIYFLPFRQLEISSTEIRDRVNKGQSIRYMVPEEVCSYIEEKGFYRA